jgi:hypothetical protein
MASNWYLAPRNEKADVLQPSDVSNRTHTGTSRNQLLTVRKPAET